MHKTGLAFSSNLIWKSTKRCERFEKETRDRVMCKDSRVAAQIVGSTPAAMSDGGWRLSRSPSLGFSRAKFMPTSRDSLHPMSDCYGHGPLT